MPMVRARVRPRAKGAPARGENGSGMHRMNGRALVAAVLMLAAAGLTACQEHTNSPVVTINIRGDRGENSFVPGNVSVNMGTLITWVNQDSQPHTVTSPGAFDSGPIAPNGGRWTWVAHLPGTWTYTSLNNPNMSGSITIVVPGPQAAPPQPPAAQ
jgi:plastocyanin